MNTKTGFNMRIFLSCAVGAQFEDAEEKAKLMELAADLGK